MLWSVASEIAKRSMHSNQHFNHTKIVNTDIYSNPSIKQLSKDAKEIAQRTDVGAKDLSGVVEEVAKEVAGATKDAAHRATETAKGMYQSVALKAKDTLATSKEYVSRNPVLVVLGAIAIGATIGYMILSARRKPTFSEQYEKAPLGAVREAILTVLTPVWQRVHGGYDSARDGVGKAMNRVNRAKSGPSTDSLSDRIGRIGSNLKFW